MLLSNSGKVVRFSETDVRAMGRTAAGVRGIRLSDNQRVISMIMVEEEGSILTSTENGYGKRTNEKEYPLKGRGGQGVISIKTSERNGDVVGAVQVKEDEEIMMITNNGTLVRIAVTDVSEMSRNTQGVRLIRLTNNEKLVEIEKIQALDTDDVEEGSTEGGTEVESTSVIDSDDESSE